MLKNIFIELWTLNQKHTITVILNKLTSAGGKKIICCVSYNTMNKTMNVVLWAQYTLKFDEIAC